MAKVLVSDKLSPEGVKILQQAGFEVDCKTGLPPEELKKIIGNYQALVVRSETQVTADVIACAKALKVVGRAGVGVDNIDVEAATRKGIIVMNAPGGNTISTCEQAFALIMACARNTPAANASTKSGKWDRSKFKGVELYSKTLGIVGMGRIGKEIAKRAIAFGMKVMVYDPFITQEIAEKLGVKNVALDELIKACDFMTVHTPLTEETKNLISAKQLSMMKPTAFVINCARGGIINEDDLYNALKEKKIKGAALDVFVEEPPTGSKLYELENLIMTPHLGASTDEAQLNVAIEIAHCIVDALSNSAIRNAVNYMQLDPETYKVIGPYFTLAEKMGRFMGGILDGAVKEVKLTYVGELSTYKVDILAGSFVKGLLVRQMGDEINDINAIELAKGRGVKIEQVKVTEDQEFANSIQACVVTDKETKTLEGTLFANKDARLVKFDGIYLEVAPTDYMLVIENQDKPGAIGFLGTVLGKHGVNIADMSLGRRKEKGMALTVLNIDSALDEKVCAEIKANPIIVSLKVVKL